MEFANYTALLPTTPFNSTFYGSHPPLLLQPNETAHLGAIFDEDQDQRRYLSPWGQLLVTLVYVLGASANACALLLLARSEQARNRKLTLLMRCLAANDLAALCCACVLVHLRLRLGPRPGRWFCALRLLARFFGFSSGSVASVMAVERCIALTRPFFYQKHVTHSVVKRAIFIQWCIVMLVVLLPLCGFGLYHRVDLDTGETVCARYRQAVEPGDVAYAYLLFGFGTTMCLVIVGCNMAVVGALCRLSPRSGLVRRTTVSRRSTNGELSFNHATQEELSFARLMAVLCVCFVVCWLPQMVSIVVAQVNPDLGDHPFFRFADACTALHFILDPIMYVLSRRPHRRGLRRLLKPLCRQCWPQPDLSTGTGSNSQEAKAKEAHGMASLPEPRGSKRW